MQLHGTDVDCSPAAEFLKSQGLMVNDDGRWILSVRPPDVPLSEVHASLAAQVQLELEQVCVGLAKDLRRSTGARHLVLGGGVFLNSVVNNRIRKEAGFDEVYVFPAATDDGTSVGAAYAALEQVSGARGTHRAPRRVSSASLGQAYSRDEVCDAVADSGLPFVEYQTHDEALTAAAGLLCAGRIIGWFQGRAEFGPRALGYRSILANPMLADMKELINGRVKFREAFRPYAPAIPAELVSEYFDLDVDSPFMLMVCDVRPHYRAVIPAITHVDGTARVQSVDRSENPLFHKLLLEFGKGSGVPILLNTSLNVNGEPIADAPSDALKYLIATELDALIIDRFLVRSKEPSALFVNARADHDQKSVPLSSLERLIVETAGNGKTVGDISVLTGLSAEECALRARALFRRRVVQLS